MNEHRWHRDACIALIGSLLLGTVALAAQETSSKEEEEPPKQQFIEISKETTHLTEPLDELGYVDYLAHANLRGKEVSAKDNILAGIWEAVGFHEDSDDEEVDEERIKEYFDLLGIAIPKGENPLPLDFADWLEKHGEEDEVEAVDPDEIEEVVFSRPWDLKDVPVYDRFLGLQEKKLVRLLDALGREKYFTPMVSLDKKAPSCLTVWLPGLMLKRDIAYALAARASRMAARGQAGQALRELGGARAGYRRMADGTLIEYLVARACEITLARAQVQIAARYKIEPRELEACLVSLDSLPEAAPLSHIFDAHERLFALDTVTLLVRNPAALDEDLGLSGIKGTMAKIGLRTGFDWNRILKAMNTEFDSMVTVAELTSRSERRAAAEKWEEAMKKNAAKFGSTLGKLAAFASVESRSDMLASLLSGLMIPSFHSMYSREETIRVESELCRLSVVLALHRARNGAFPESLDKLVPGELDAVPIDPFSGKPMEYRLVGEGFELVSVGPDGEKSVPGETEEWDDDDIRLDVH